MGNSPLLPCRLYQRDSRTGRHFDGQLDLKFTPDPGTAAPNIPVFLSTTAGILASLAQLRIEKFEESYGRTSGLCYYSRTESAKIAFDGGGRDCPETAYAWAPLVMSPLQRPCREIYPL